MTDQRHRGECLLDVAVYAPIGLALTIGEHLPARVRQGARLVEDRVRVARAFGELAVRFGRAEIERELLRQRAEPVVDDAPVAAAPDETPEPGETTPVAPASSPAAETLPISDYESLAAIHVVQRLGSLRDDEIEQIRSFEQANPLLEARGGVALLAEQAAAGDWTAVLTAADRRVWVATIDDVVVGYLELVTPVPGGAGVVRQVYVLPGAREVGFGDELLATAIQAIRDLGGTAIESFALPGDRETKNLYERAGVTARKIIVSKRLDG
ncbi:MAG: GNAT family N-acetyltransferase [Actinobacteria bacterium]|nr:GNAT family N-acetyltransferase [Actinomycetota bacterium]